MSDWDASDDEKTAPKTAVASGSGAAAGTAAAPLAPVVPRQNRFAGEDEEEEGDDWDASDDDKSAAPKAPTAAPRKKGTLKQKLAEKAALAAAGGGQEDDLIDETTPQERRRREQERKLQEKLAEQEADLAHAADLLGLKDDDTSGLAKANPKTDADYRALAGQIHAAYLDRLASKPRYTVFVDELIKLLLAPLTDVEARKVNTAVGVIANTKTTEAKDKSSGKKKGGAKAKPVLGAGKALVSKPDTELYDEALDDDLDFM